MYSLLFINGIRVANHVTGAYPGLGNLHSSWFLSVLMFTTLFYSSLLRFCKVEKFVFYTLIICVATLYQASYGIHMFFCDGVLRGFGGVGLGCLFGLAYSKMREMDLHISDRYFNLVAVKIGLTIIQLTLLITLSIGLFADYKGRFVMTDFLVIFGMILTLLLINKDYCSRALNQSICSKLGRYAFAIYLSHCVTVEVLKNCFINQEMYHYLYSIVGTFVNLSTFQFFILFFILNSVVCILFGILAYHLFEAPFKLKVPLWIPK